MYYVTLLEGMLYLSYMAYDRDIVGGCVVFVAGRASSSGIGDMLISSNVNDNSGFIDSIEHEKF